MAYTNSSLVSVTQISPNKNSPRNHAIDTITIHCYVGQVSVERGLKGFADPNRQASANYVIGTDGRIGLCVDEKDRSWCSSSKTNDNRAITIECASDNTYPYAFNDAVMQSLKALVVDICKRNGIKKLIWSDKKSDRVNHVNGCNMTAHRDFAAKSCPGDWFYSREGKFADEVNEVLNPAVVISPPQTQTPTVSSGTNKPQSTERPYKYVNSDGYIINVFDIEKEWTPWFACGSAYATYPKPAYTAKVFAAKQNADICYNLALFSFSTKQTVTYVRTQEFGDVGYGGVADRVELSWKNKCGGYAVAIKAGVVQANTSKNKYLGGKSCRNGIGFTYDGRLIIAQSINKVTEAVFAKKVNTYIPAMFGTKVRLFLFEDGGGSTQEYSAISGLNFQPMGARPVPTVTCLMRRVFPKVTRTLQKGDTGWDVMRLQMVLGGICTDGSFGVGTRSRIKEYQKLAKLSITGVADKATLKSLGLM